MKLCLAIIANVTNQYSTLTIDVRIFINKFKYLIFKSDLVSCGGGINPSGPQNNLAIVFSTEFQNLNDFSLK
jgi:hypothetical protein